MYYRIYRKSTDFNVIEGIRYKGASVKIIEQAGEFIVVMRMFILRRIPYYVKKFHFDTLPEAEIKYEYIKNYLKRFG